jgi:hypothetical protein
VIEHIEDPSQAIEVAFNQQDCFDWPHFSHHPHLTTQLTFRSAAISSADRKTSVQLTRYPDTQSRREFQITLPIVWSKLLSFERFPGRFKGIGIWRKAEGLSLE